jgi:pyruvate formate lyase activating enzyme
MIDSFRPFTLSDFPGKVAAILFLRGCNFRCGYCHNPSLVNGGSGNGDCSESFFNLLNRRKGKLEGVVITGGEPTIFGGVTSLIEKIKRMGYQVKLDTNGSCPGVLEVLFSRRLVDYVAMDIKGPPEKYSEIAGRPVEMADIRKSIRLIRDSGIDYEFRTTVVREQLSIEDLVECGRLIEGAKRYILQEFVARETMASSFKNCSSYSADEFAGIVSRVVPLVQECRFRQ